MPHNCHNNTGRSCGDYVRLTCKAWTLSTHMIDKDGCNLDSQNLAIGCERRDRVIDLLR